MTARYSATTNICGPSYGHLDFFSLYNKVEPRQEWLDVARNIFAFVKKYGRDDQGRWRFAVNKKGRGP